MKLVADESVDHRIIEGLRFAGHEIISVTEEVAGADDEQVLPLAETHGTILRRIGRSTALSQASRPPGEVPQRCSAPQAGEGSTE